MSLIWNTSNSDLTGTLGSAMTIESGPVKSCLMVLPLLTVVYKVLGCIVSTFDYINTSSLLFLTLDMR